MNFRAIKVKSYTEDYKGTTFKLIILASLNKKIMIKRMLSLVTVVFIGLNTFSQPGIKADKLKEHVYFLASDELEGRGVGTESGRKAGEYIRNYFESIGLDPVGESYFHQFPARIGQTMLKGKNVVGMVKGSDPVLKDEYIVIGAHYDHISYRLRDGEKVVYNGADDNASGTAAVMELGKALVGMKEKLKRSVVLVAFDAEESGLIGSSQFVRQLTLPVEQIKLMFSIDMIGRYAESKSLIMGALAHLKGGPGILKPLADQHKVKIKRTGGETSMFTDTKPFGDAGIPAVYVSTGIVGPYHKPEDDRETLDYEGMELISNLMLDLAVDLANEEELVAQPQLEAKSKVKGLPFARLGVKGSLGGSSNTYPDEFYKAKSGFSYELGMITQLKLTRNIFVQPELLYTSLGSKHADGKYRVHSLTVPLSLLFASNMQSGTRQRTFASVGGYYSYHFAGSLAGKSLDFASEYNPSEFGMVYGFGIEVMSVYVAMNFKNAFTNIFIDEGGGKIKNRAIYFTLGYFF